MAGIAPGFTIRDGEGDLYFIKFDPPANPDMASGAEVISTKFFYAFGYHVPENYIATVRRESIVIGEGALIDDDNGRRRQMDTRDLDLLLKRVAHSPDGSYRALASKALEGKPVGPFRYYGTRPDDPNDIFPHEHRRELRGLLVFCAWLNHDDSRSINSLDTLGSAPAPAERSSAITCSISDPRSAAARRRPRARAPATSSFGSRGQPSSRCSPSASTSGHGSRCRTPTSRRLDESSPRTSRPTTGSLNIPTRHSPTRDRRIVSGPRVFLPASPTTACARSSTRRGTPTARRRGIWSRP